MEAYHGGDRLPLVSYFNAAAAVGGIVPSLPAESGAVEAGRESVGGERASSALYVAAVEGRPAGDGAFGEEVLVGSLCRDCGGESSAEHRKERERDVELHVDNVFIRQACCQMVKR